MLLSELLYHLPTSLQDLEGAWMSPAGIQSHSYPTRLHFAQTLATRFKDQPRVGVSAAFDKLNCNKVESLRKMRDKSSRI